MAKNANEMNRPEFIRDVEPKKYKCGRVDKMGLFLCGCGKEFTAALNHIKSGNTKSCGCLQIKAVKDMAITHGLSGTPLYRIWRNMRGRCYVKTHQAYKYYGGRGIVVCDRWKDSFMNFYNDMLPSYIEGFTLDRYPNKDGNYEPNNVRWATIIEQANNRRPRRSGYKTKRKIKLFEYIKTREGV